MILNKILCIAASCLCLNAYSQIEPLTPLIETESADVYIQDFRFGVVLSSPDGSCFRFRVENDGTMKSEPVQCTTTNNPSISMTPPNATILMGSTQTFTISPNKPGWTFGFWIGSINDINSANSVYFNSGALSPNNVITATGLPTNGEPLYLRTAIDKGNGIEHEIFSYTAFTDLDADCPPDYTNCNYSATKISNNTAASGVRHYYSTMSAFNSNSTRIVLQQGSLGTTIASVQVLTDINGNILTTLPLNKFVHWSRLDPNIIFGVVENANGTESFARHNIATNVTSPIFTTSSTIQMFKGTHSYDDRYVVFKDGETIKTLDTTNGNILGSIPNPGLTFSYGLYMSPCGKYVITFEDVSATSRHVFRYDIDLTNRTFLLTNTNHLDLNMDCDGNSILAVLGNLEFVNIATGQSTFVDTTPAGGQVYGHITGSTRPGSFLISGKYAGDRMLYEIFVSDGVDALSNIEVWEDLEDHNVVFVRAQRKVSGSIDGRYAIYTKDHNDGTYLHDEFVIKRVCP